MRDGPSKFVIRDGQFYNMSVKNNLQRAHIHTHAAVDENRVMIKKEYVEMIKDELQTEVCFIF